MGPFIIRRVLGEGKMGVVYEAVHSDTGERVALKTVSVPQTDYLSSIRREIHTLARLQHRGVVGIRDEGVDQGRPWYAMELLEGRTLRDYIDGLWRAAAPSKASSTAIDGDSLSKHLVPLKRLCEALSFIHGEGIVHGDIKPENVFLRVDDWPVLVDFGLAWRFAGRGGREVLDDLFGLAGTPSHMSPEQIRGEPIDARADLYAFGCVLFEMMTGRPPFVGTSAAEVLAQHLSAPPPRPSRSNPAVPPALDALVAALLEKQPAQRLGHADDVVSELDRLCNDGLAVPKQRTQVPILYSPGLQGRDAVLQQVLRAVDDASRSSGGFVVIAGESGVGKTYLAAEVARRSSDRLRVVVGSCGGPGNSTALAAGQPLQPFHGLLATMANLCAERGEAFTDRCLGARGPVLATYEPALLGLPGQMKFSAQRESSGAAAQAQVMEALAQTMEALAEEQPLLLLLDDLQWADELTLRFLRWLPRDWFAERRILLLATLRSDEVAAELRQGLERADIRWIDIEGVDQPTVGTIIREMLALREVPGALSHTLARHSAGNPFYIAEYLRTAIGEGFLQRLPLGRLALQSGNEVSSAAIEALPLPGSLRMLVARRLVALEPMTRVVVETAAVLGRELDSELLQRVCGLGAVQTMEAVDELLRKQALEHVGPSRLRFAHDKLHEIAYEQLSVEQRRTLHATAAIALENGRSSGAIAAHDCADLAHHWSKAENSDREIVYSDRAGRHALAGAAFDDAARHLRRASELAELGVAYDGQPVPPRVRAEWQQGIARAEEVRGNGEAMELHARRALATLGYPLPTSKNQWTRLIARQVIIQIAHLLGWQRAPRDRAQQLTLRTAAPVLTFLQQRYFYTDDTPAMMGAALLAANLAERAECPNDVPRSYLPLAFLAAVAGSHRLADRYFERSRRGVEALNDPWERAYHEIALSVTQCTFGDWRAGEETVRAAQHQLTATRDPFIHDLVLTQAGHVAFFTGRFEESFGCYQQLHDGAARRGNSQMRLWGLYSMARSLNACQRFGEAEHLLAQARTGLKQQSEELMSEIICFGLSAQALAHLGQLDQARHWADETLVRIRRTSSVGFPAAEGYSGAVDAYLTLMARARQLADRDLRRAASAAVRALWTLGKRTPCTMPMAFYRSGQFAEVLGRPRRARRHYTRVIALAARYGMPREQALGHAALATLAPAGSAARIHHQTQATQLFRDMPSEWQATQPMKGD